jgi:hypothetical protein
MKRDVPFLPLLWFGMGVFMATAVSVPVTWLFSQKTRTVYVENKRTEDTHRDISEPTKSSKESSGPSKKTYPRDEFHKLVVGKTKDEILKLLGKPENTSDSTYISPYWTYHKITVDPVTDKVDAWVLVYFTGDIVKSVSPSP